jgi:purine-binding chemotaxis protein CheW
LAERGGARFLVFESAGRRYACSLDAVREIVSFRVGTRLPGAPAHVVGLINLRGRLLTVVDLAVFLGGRDAGEARAAGSIVLVAAGTRVVGVLVDEVRDVRLIADDAVEQVTDATITHGAVRALARLDDGIAVVLDTDAIVGNILQERAGAGENSL